MRADMRLEHEAEHARGREGQGEHHAGLEIETRHAATMTQSPWRPVKRRGERIQNLRAGSRRSLREGKSAMIRARSSSVSFDQPPISPSVRRHPRHRPERPATVQTWMQGVATGRGGRLEFGALNSDIGSDATRPRR